MAFGRPVGSGTKVRETCATHTDGRVVLFGKYGKEPNRRQMYQCIPADGSKRHKFAGASPRLVADAATCGQCENPVAAHEGPRVARTYDFPVAQAVAALVMVGQGVSYTESADRTRVRNQRGRFASGAQLVANWVEARPGGHSWARRVRVA